MKACKDCENEYDCRLTQACLLEHDDELLIGRWHRYPDERPKNGTYLVTVGIPNGSRMTWRTAVTYRTSRGNLWDDQWRGKGFYYTDPEYGAMFLTDVIAWAEFPEPYKDEENG